VHGMRSALESIPPHCQSRTDLVEAVLVVEHRPPEPLRPHDVPRRVDFDAAHRAALTKPHDETLDSPGGSGVCETRSVGPSTILAPLRSAAKRKCQQQAQREDQREHDAKERPPDSRRDQDQDQDLPPRPILVALCAARIP
jgi:hypothetical protein